MPSVPDGSGAPPAPAAPAPPPAPAAPVASAPPTASAAPAPRVIAVVVTYNRRDLLLEAVAAVQAQTRPADAVIVVDNASTDGTAAEVRRQYPSVHLARSEERR